MLASQHVTHKAERIGTQRLVPFDSMTAIKALPGDVLQLACKERDFYFQLSSRDETTRWATNLVTLALEAGHVIPGYMVVQPAEGDADQEAMAGAESYSSMAASVA